MWGAVIGDIVGSRYEFANHRSKEFELFTPRNYFTDDSVMTIAVAKALLSSYQKPSEEIEEAARKEMQAFGRLYPDCGFGGMFYHWVFGDGTPYDSFGNGAAMRVSAAGWFGGSEAETVRLADAVTRISHGHPEGIKGARATALSVFWARNGKSKDEIKALLINGFYPEIARMSCNNIRPFNMFNETCQGSVPHALTCFLESESFEDTIRNAVSIGGDTDTIAAIAGGVAEAFYGVPEEFIEKAKGYLTKELLSAITEVNEYLASNPI